jgi:hypothetical protein
MNSIPGSCRGVLPLLAVVILVGCGPPQIGTDEHTYNTVDALYTAVCAKRPDLVDQCERELTELKKDKRIPEAAHARLAAIIQETRDDHWTSASQRLSKFMEGQTQAPVHEAESPKVGSATKTLN